MREYEEEEYERQEEQAKERVQREAATLMKDRLGARSVSETYRVITNRHWRD